MISAFANTLKIPELRQRIFFTLAMVVVVRIGAAITLPGVDAGVLQEALKHAGNATDNAIGALVNVFSGGGLANCAIFALGIMPYISASIMMQLLTAVVPKLSKLAREDGGRQKINMYTRYATIILCLVQALMLARSLENPQNNIFLKGIASAIETTGRPLVPGYGMSFVIVTVLVITAGTMLLMWLGEQITERGIGNGISLIISINIVSALPGAMVQAWKTFIGTGGEGGTMSPIYLVLLIAFLFAVIAAIISLTQAQRRITVQYAKRVVGRKVYGGQSSYLPLKVNYAGVMPIIFAQAILLFPAQILSFAFPKALWVQKFSEAMGAGSLYYIFSGILIFFFSYFWVATMFQPSQIAEDLKKNGGYIPGVRPGKPTADFLDYTMSRLTFAGAVFLTVVAVLPAFVSRALGINHNISQFFGGTSILILVGVLLDVMRQAETHLLQRHYDGFLRKGKIRGRSGAQGGTGSAGSGNSMIFLYAAIGLLLIIGMAYYISLKG
jgi:preprotein translocase subunit SecY